MPFLQRLLIMGILSLPTVVWAQNTPDSSDDKALVQLLNEGANLARAGKPDEAIRYFDKVISGYEEIYSDEKAKLYSARTSQEALSYMLDALVAKTDAKTVTPNWANAYYLKGWALIELRRLTEAKQALRQAIALSPSNAMYLSELGHVYQMEKNWPEALKAFQYAETAAMQFSLPEQKNGLLARAWRGQGYVYVEQGKFDEAEKMYLRCLELDSSDSAALNELRFIEAQRKKAQ